MINENKQLTDKKKLTAAQKKRLNEFNKIREELLEQGYKEKPLIISALKANIMVLVTTGPFCLIAYILFLAIHAGSYKTTKLDLLFLIAAFIGIVIHELIHGITFAAFCKKKWRAVGFGVDWSTLTPYCSCNEGLTVNKYRLAGAMPTIVLGILPYVIGLVLGNYWFAMFGLFLILGGGGDAFILWMTRKEKNSIMVDHPYLIGCVAFEK
jgi:hypothetical protein